MDEAHAVAAAEDISLFDLEVVQQGAVEIDSSSGSSSDSSSSSDESDGPAVLKPDVNAFSEEVPEGLDFYKHKKSAIVHRVKSGGNTATCGAVMTKNFQMMPRILRVKWPKCLKCFPKDSNRIRNLDQLSNALDAAVHRCKKPSH